MKYKQNYHKCSFGGDEWNDSLLQLHYRVFMTFGMNGSISCFGSCLGRNPFQFVTFFVKGLISTSLTLHCDGCLNEWYALMTRRKERQIHDCRSEDHIFAGPNILFRKPVWSGASPMVVAPFCETHTVYLSCEKVFNEGGLTFFSFSEAVKSHICSQ